MLITYHNTVEQGSDEWYALRCGILTASEMKHIITPTLKTANNDKTRSHVYEIAAQRINKYVEPQYISDDMLRGKEDEIYALELYAKEYGDISECGFISNKTLGFTIGYSPDALVGTDGLVECKSRCQKYQVQTIAEDIVPTEYMLQLQTGLWVTQRKWIDFVSYCSGMPMYVKRVYVIPEYQDAIECAAIEFEEKANNLISAYESNASKFHMTFRRDNEFDII